MTKPDPISTSRLASVLHRSIQVLDKLVGPAEAQFFMMRGNEYLGGITPVEAIKTKRTAGLQNAIRIVAMEKGIFRDPYEGEQ
ncbi:hypothetical protein [Bradyrhizobium ottawaense]|uniref:DUF2384 domain-containing protein n=1 Tax=Bradyrhizobium ottawaense TaxID=931866 RepID=A0ABY0QH69_9BRAD|nr:hypothetical protein [Bradyrhizobium ottawaense]SDK41788.1 hypothetical protein SAMN05444163_8063 [Bradyrhizobium ottawaense]